MKPTSRTNAHVLRGELLKRGYTVAGFARKHGYNRRTVKAALRGERTTGPVSRRILDHVHRVIAHAN